MPFIREKEEQEFDILEAKLELLHKCLVPSDSPDDLPMLLQSPGEKSKNLEAYSKFIIQRNRCPKDNTGKFLDGDNENGEFVPDVNDKTPNSEL